MARKIFLNEVVAKIGCAGDGRIGAGKEARQERDQEEKRGLHGFAYTRSPKLRPVKNAPQESRFGRPDSSKFNFFP